MRLPAARTLHWVGMLVVVALYALVAQQLYRHRAANMTQEIQVRLPLFAQVGMAAGDRYLAANLAGFRALIVSTEAMRPENYRVLAQVQRDVAWLNPAHEDNYYIAAAILPWNGNDVDAAQEVLRRAMTARPYDWQPDFYYAFHLYHFKRDPASAAKVLQEAAAKASAENDRLVLLNLAARWYEKGYNPNVAIGVLKAMAESSQPGGFRTYLLKRAERLRGLAELQRAAEDYRTQRGVPIRSLDDLVAAGLIKAVPKDPFGRGYTVNDKGEPILAPRRKRQ